LVFGSSLKIVRDHYVERKQRKPPAIQPYRKRLIEVGVIEASRRSELVFAVTCLEEYLLG
jgi:hypothetical protein